MPNDHVHYHEQRIRNISLHQYNMYLKVDVTLTVTLLNVHFMHSYCQSLQCHSSMKRTSHF